MSASIPAVCVQDIADIDLDQPWSAGPDTVLLLHKSDLGAQGGISVVTDVLRRHLTGMPRSAVAS